MRKSLLIAFLIAVMIGGLILVSIVHIGMVQASTNVTGIINSDTTWTAASSPYNLTGPVLVSQGVTLAIDPSVTVNINSYYIQVDGTLYARGNNTKQIYINGGQITFTSLSTHWIEQTGSGCIIENAILTSSITCPVNSNASPKINNNTITNGVTVQSGSPIISNNTLYSGISLGCPVPQGPINAIVSNNVFSGCGIRVFTGGGISTIEKNLLMGGNGINIINGQESQPLNPVIQNNTITNNSNGISLSFQGIQFGTVSPVITNNNIYANDININSRVHDNITAIYNWWGTTDVSSINQTIYDNKNDFNWGIVTFIPFLTAPNPEAPISPTFTISASAGPGGSISPSGSVSVNYSSSQTFTVTANTGYQIVSVLMDGSPATAPYTFSNVVADGHTISVTFQAIPVIPEIPPLLLFATLTMVTVAVILFKRQFESGVLKQKNWLLKFLQY